MNGKQNNSEIKSSQKNNEGEIKILSLISEWVESSTSDQAMIVDHIYWT